MSLTNYILTCEKDNEKLRYELSYYKNYSKRLEEKNRKYKEVIDKMSKIIYEIDESRKTTGGYPSNYIDDLLSILKEVEHEQNI